MAPLQSTLIALGTPLEPWFNVWASRQHSH
jgi:hypothetical protein